MPWVVALYLGLAWICYRKSGTYDETGHRMALAGACLLGLIGATLLLRQICGLPKLVLTPEHLTERSLLEKKRFAWSRYGQFTVGITLGPLESIDFVDTETGVKESLFNLTSMSSETLCSELSKWRDRFCGGSAGVAIAPNNRWSGRES
jgi:hypothetical protein